MTTSNKSFARVTLGTDLLKIYIYPVIEQCYGNLRFLVKPVLATEYVCLETDRIEHKTSAF